jgi:competence protein ComEA
MDAGHGAIKSGEPPCTSAGPAPLLTWPIGVQIALGLLVTASLFFLLGRWSQVGAPTQPEMAMVAERVGPTLDLNRATRAELRLLPGLGDALVKRIVEHRTRNGPFRSVDELRQVAGIGPMTLDRLRHHLFVTPDESFVAEDDTEAMPMESKPRTMARASMASKKAIELTQPINVNAAPQAELQKLPGIGPKLSQRILDERAKSAFKSIDDLRRVPGIGPKTLEKLRPHVTVDSI